MARSTTLVSWLVTLTSAFATNAPLASCTVPAIAPVAPPWANACEISASAVKLIQINLCSGLGIVFSLPLNMEIKFMVIEEWGAERTGNQREHTAQLSGTRAGLRCGCKEIARIQLAPWTNNLPQGS